jgi:hypothetical protein
MSTVNKNCYYTVCVTTYVIYYHMLHGVYHLNEHIKLWGTAEFVTAVQTGSCAGYSNNDINGDGS